MSTEHNIKVSFLPSQATRLIVLVPEMTFTPICVSKKITDLAGDQIRQVVYLAVPQNPIEDMSLTDKLNHLYAATHSNRIRVEVQVQYGATWLKAIRGLVQPEDVVVCPEEYVIRWRGLWHRPLKSVLMDAIKAPIYLMPFHNHAALCNQAEINEPVLMEWNPNGHKKNKEK